MTGALKSHDRPECIQPRCITWFKNSAEAKKKSVANDPTGFQKNQLNLVKFGKNQLKLDLGVKAT
jgi:hypothetical protein